MEYSNDELFFQLLDQFMKMSQPGFDNWEKTSQQWSEFKTLISKRPIDYNQVFNFISKMQENGTESSPNSEQIPVYCPQQPTNILEAGSSSRSNNFLKNTQSQSGSALKTANLKANDSSSQRTAENTERSSDLFAPNNSYMFKTAAASIQTSHSNQSNKKEDPIQLQQAPTRSSTREHPHKSINGDILGTSQLTQKSNHRASFNGGASPQIVNAFNTNNPTNGGTLGFKGKVGGNVINPKNEKDKESANESVQFNSNALGQSQSNLPGKNNNNNNNLNTQKNTHTNYQQTSVQGNGHHNRDMRSDPTCNDDQNLLYTMKSFDQFLRQHTRIHLGSNKATFTNTSVLQLRQDQNTLLKFVATSLFVNILSELPHPESPTENSCTSSKAFLIEIFLKIYNKKLVINSSPLQSVNSADSMYNSLTKNLGQLLQLYCLHGQSPMKLVRTFLHQIQSDAIFLDSLSALMKNLVGEFVEESEYETIAWFLNQQQQQQQQNVSMASTCASISQFNDKNSEKERRMKLGSKLRTSEWTAVKAEWLFLLSLALQRPIELFNLRDNKLEQTLFKSKKMVVSSVVFNNKINILTLTPLAPAANPLTNQVSHQSQQTYYLLTMSEAELDVYSQAISKKTGKLDLRLSEEVNFTYLLKHLNYQPVNQSPKHNPVIAPAAPSISGNGNVVIPPAVQPQYSPLVTQFKESASKEREYSLGHRSSKLGSHFNSTQDPNKPLQHQIHNSSVEDQFDLKSQNYKNNIQPAFQGQPGIQSNSASSSNPQNLTPRIQGFVLSPQAQQQQQQQQIPTYSPDPKLSLGGAFGRLQTGTLINTNTHKSAATYLNQKSNLNSVNPTDDWNRTALTAKVKDMLFKLNISTEQLNHLAKFPLSSQSATPTGNGLSNPTTAGLQSKENIHPKSPLKYKNVLYPINQHPSTTQNTNSTSSLASFPFSSYLPQSSQAPASTNNLGTSNSFGISSTSHGIGSNNYNNNTSYISGVSSNNNFGINHESRQQQQLQQAPNNNINSINMIHSNQIGQLSPTPATTQNNQLASSSNNPGMFTSSFQKSTYGNNNNPHSFLGVGNFAFSSAGSINTGGNGPSSLSTAGSFKRHPNNINSNNNNHYNIGNSELQQRDILHKLSPRRNLNTQY